MARGYITSKRVYFYGIKVHIVVDGESFIYEFVVVRWGSHNWNGWANVSFYFLKAGDMVVCERAYPRYEEETKREEILGILVREKGKGMKVS